MDLQKLTIGQMAKLNHVSEQTLRLYDREGLLVPLEVDSGSKYRYYHIVQSARLDLIQDMKTYGMTLRQIGEYLRTDDADAIKKLLLEQRRRIDDSIAQLSRSRRAATRALENYKKYEALPRSGEIFFEYIGERRLYRYQCSGNFFEQDEAGYEYMLRELKEHLVLNDIPLSYFCNIGTIVRQEYLAEGRLFSNEVFMFVDEAEQPHNAETVPAATYLCVCSDDFNQEAANARRLLGEIDRLDYAACGDYLCEVVVDFPVLEFNKRRMFYKIQIPIKPR